MTIETVIVQARLKEASALSRVRRAIAASASDPAWAYVVAAIDERLYRLRELLARDDPQVIRDCEQQMDHEGPIEESSSIDGPSVARVH